jgi:hypothetical protein
MSKSWKLDTASEYFEFEIFGNRYKFRYPTTTELSEIGKLSDDVEKGAEVEEETLTDAAFARFITPVEEGGTPFSEVWEKMNTKHLITFRKMVAVEITGQEDARNTR